MTTTQKTLQTFPSHFEGESSSLVFFENLGKFCKTTLKISENLVDFEKFYKFFKRLCNMGVTDGLRCDNSCCD